MAQGAGHVDYERTAIEIGVSARAKLLFGTYDQLNCPCLAGMKVVCQRLAQLIDAYAGGDASRPNFKGVRHFVSEVSSTNVVPVHLRAYAHKKAKEKHDMEALRFKAGAGTPGGGSTHATGGGDDDDDDGGAPLGGHKPRKPKPKPGAPGEAKILLARVK